MDPKEQYEEAVESGKNGPGLGGAEAGIVRSGPPLGMVGDSGLYAPDPDAENASDTEAGGGRFEGAPLTADDVEAAP